MRCDNLIFAPVIKMMGIIIENMSGIPSNLNIKVQTQIKAKVIKYSIKYKAEPSVGNPPE